MKLPRRNFLHLAAGAAALPAVSRIARAQAYLTRPVRVLEGFGSGSSADLAARLIGLGELGCDVHDGMPQIRGSGCGSHLVAALVRRCAGSSAHSYGQ
jgi:hypothetical protein